VVAASAVTSQRLRPRVMRSLMDMMPAERAGGVPSLRARKIGQSWRSQHPARDQTRSLPVRLPDFPHLAAPPERRADLQVRREGAIRQNGRTFRSAARCDSVERSNCCGCQAGDQPR
jgi:hypothetical protein